MSPADRPRSGHRSFATGLARWFAAFSPALQACEAGAGCFPVTNEPYPFAHGHRTRNKRAFIILAITWVGIAAVAANWYFSRRGEANAKADLQAREAEFMAKMDKIAAEEARKRAKKSARPAPAGCPAPGASADTPQAEPEPKPEPMP